MHYVYVLECRDLEQKILYVGSTSDLKKRLAQHLRKEVTTTKKFASVVLVYYEACLDKTDALIREKQLKTGFGRGYLKRRLENYNMRD